MMLRRSWVVLLCVLTVFGQGPPGPAGPPPATPAEASGALVAAVAPVAAVPVAAVPPQAVAPMPNPWIAGGATPHATMPTTMTVAAPPPAHTPAPLGFGHAHGGVAMGGGMMGMAVSPFAPSAGGPPCFAYEVVSGFLVSIQFCFFLFFALSTKPSSLQKSCPKILLVMVSL